jgi:hypothetical protein
MCIRCESVEGSSELYNRNMILFTLLLRRLTQSDIPNICIFSAISSIHSIYHYGNIYTIRAVVKPILYSCCIIYSMKRSALVGGQITTDPFSLKRACFYTVSCRRGLIWLTGWFVWTHYLADFTWTIYLAYFFIRLDDLFGRIIWQILRGQFIWPIFHKVGRFIWTYYLADFTWTIYLAYFSPSWPNKFKSNRYPHKTNQCNHREIQCSCKKLKSKKASRN